VQLKLNSAVCIGCGLSVFVKQLGMLELSLKQLLTSISGISLAFFGLVISKNFCVTCGKNLAV